MKTMKTYTLLLFIIVTAFSCKDDEVKEEKDPYIYAQQVFYSTAVANKRDLQIRQEEIQDIIDAGNAQGNDDLTNELENNTLKIEKLGNLVTYLLGIDPSVGPIGPIPIPPKGCLVAANCIPTQNLTDITGMVLHENIEITYVTLFDAEVGDITDLFIPGDMFLPTDMFLPGDMFNDQDVWLLNKDSFTPNITKMGTTIKFGNNNETVLLEIPITIE